MIGRELLSGHLAADFRVPVSRMQNSLRAIWADPYIVCLAVVACMPVLALVSASMIVWRPLGIVGLIVGAYWFPRVHRATSDIFGAFAPKCDRAVGQHWAIGVGVVLAALVMSVPVTQIFFEGDLRTFAAPTIALADTGEHVLVGGIPEAIYGSSPEEPSFVPCRTAQRLVGQTMSWPCYSAVGYLRLWRIPTAFPMLSCIALMFAGYPLVLLRAARNRKVVK